MTPVTLATPATPAGHRRGRIKWTSEMEEAILEGLVEAVNKGYCVDSSYKANSWKIASIYIIAVAQQPITFRQIKSKHNNYKRD